MTDSVEEGLTSFTATTTAGSREVASEDDRVW